MMIIWIYRNYIFISQSQRVVVVVSSSWNLSSFHLVWLLLVDIFHREYISISLNAINSNGSKGTHCKYVYATEMQIRHAKSSRLFCETWNKIVILQRAKYLLTVNSFPEIYYYYYHYFVVVLFFISSLAWMDIGQALRTMLIVVIVNVLSISFAQMQSSRSHCSTQMKCQWNRLSFAVVYYFMLFDFCFALLLLFPLKNHQHWETQPQNVYH